MHYGVTGTRKLNKMEVEQVRYELWELDRNGNHWHIGDADGVDRTAREWVTGKQMHYNSEGWEAWQLAARSTKLVKAVAANGGTLHAWANKLAPEGLKPSRCWKCASGSGTWGTVALAVGLGVKVELHWLGEEQVKPDWLP
jgi:hypothetical protein